MGKSTSSCFKIITCAGDPTDNDDLASAESKASSDKRRWSFRKISARHRVLSNTVISEPLSVGYNKESPEAATYNFHSQTNSSVLEEKNRVEQTNETLIVSSAALNSELALTPLPASNATTIDYKLQDSDVVVIQAAIRGYLAQKEIRKLKNVIKLQAAVRGHLVRRQAVGTLRCVQAIIKMQALVRARHARQPVEKRAAKERLDEKLQIDIQRSTLMGKENSDKKPNKAYSSTEKLLSNGFARQLLESTPKTKPIHISCDPSRSDSAWKWLERWMAVTSPDIGQQKELNLNQGHQGQEENSELAAHEEVNEFPVAVASVSSASKLAPSESTLPTEGEGNMVTNNSNDLDFQAPASVPEKCVSSLARDDQEHSELENEALSMTQEKHTKTESSIKETSDDLSTQIPFQSDTTLQPVFYSNSDKSELERENPKRATESVACEPPENEGKKSIVGSRRACNPSFAAAQSKFKELSSTPTVGRSVASSGYQDATIESQYDSLHCQVDSLTRTKDLSLRENSISHDPIVQIAASECGTEISISSTLDSPDRSEAEGGEIVLEIGALEKENYDVNAGADKAFNLENTNGDIFQPQRLEEGDGNPANLVASNHSVQVEQEPTTSDMQIQVENLIDQQAYRSSPEGSPRSHITAPESHGTPSSHISVNNNQRKADKNMPARKQKSKLVGKGSPTNPNDDSGARSSTEQLPKDVKTAKRRSSFGMAKPDQVDHEPRISSSNSLPSYMQATESAKAKAHASISPKSSPDVLDKDNYMKKRHSLPIGNGKQGSSPRMQRSTSQAQPTSKGNGTHSPHNSAERRWQR